MAPGGNNPGSTDNRPANLTRNQSKSDVATKPHYLGHRARLRERLVEKGGEALSDYEVLEILLFAGNPRGDTKPLAKALLREFGSFAAVLAADPGKLGASKGMGIGAVAALKAAQEAARRMTREQAMERPVIASWEKLLSYCRVAMAEEPVEQFRLLFLNRKNKLIADEAQGRGTVDHTPVYPREVVKRALELGASAVILVHNHPSGDPTPSKADVQMTKAIVEAAKPLGIQVHDHVIIARAGHTSFKSRGLL